MRKIKTFNQFAVGATNEMFYNPPAGLDIERSLQMQTDAVLGSLKKAGKHLCELFQSGEDNAEKLMMNIPSKMILNKIEDYFGAPVQDLDADKIMEVLVEKNKHMFETVKESKVNRLFKDPKFLPDDSEEYWRKVDYEERLKEYKDIYKTKSLTQKVLSVIEAILGANAVGGMSYMIGSWILEFITSLMGHAFSLIEWVQSLPVVQNSQFLEQGANPGSWGFFAVMLVLSVAAALIVGLIKKIHAKLMVDPGTPVKDSKDKSNWGEPERFEKKRK